MIDVELEVRTKQAGGVRVVQDVFLLIKLVLQDVVDQTAVEGKVRTRTDARIDVGSGGRAGVARVDHDPRGALVLSAFNPTGGERMVFDVVRTDRHDDVGVGEVAPVARHGAAPERRSKAGHGRGVADARLVVDREHAEASRKLLHEPAFLVVELGGAETCDAVAAVDRHVAFLLDEGGVAGLLDVARDFKGGLIPGEALPGLAARTANHRIEHAVRMELRAAVLRHDIAKAPHGGALRAQAAEVDRVIRVAFKIDELAVSGRADRAAAA